MSTLPTSRAFLTSIISTLTTAFPPSTNPPTDTAYDAPTNPLKALPPSHRALLTTLHVLFPPPMLLQALDLLDRGLVTRLIHKSESESESQQETSNPVPLVQEPGVWPPQAHSHLPPSSPQPEIEDGSGEQEKEGKMEKGRENVMYSVRSSQPTKGRYASTIGGMMYTVHLGSWNCSCAAFAFSAFPASSFGSGGNPWNLGEEDEFELRLGEKQGQEEDDGEKDWEFGGLSFDGKSGDGGVPVCKHLLACLLAERWKDVLGGYVKEMRVAREEMAGYGAE